jgi:hypothetical protein
MLLYLVAKLAVEPIDQREFRQVFPTNNFRCRQRVTHCAGEYEALLEERSNIELPIWANFPRKDTCRIGPPTSLRPTEVNAV